MTVAHGKSTKVLINGYDLSAFFNSADIAWEVNADETTCFGSLDRTYITGLRTGTISLGGYFEASSSTYADPILAAGLGSSTSNLKITYAPDGLVVGS